MLECIADVSGLVTSSTAKPNPAHFALAKLEDKLQTLLFVCTQNVDNLHEQAGSRNIVHMHGELFKSRCDTCSPSVITSKAANGYHFKTGQRDWPSRTENVLPCRLLWWQVGFGAPAPGAALEHVAVVQ